MLLLPQNSWEVKKLPKIGQGIFTHKDIPAGTVIGDYIGTVIPPKEEDKYDNKGHFYLMYYHDRASIFPDVKKPGVHTINHSCTPNVWMHTYKGHTLYFAIRRILAGEELTVSYLLSQQDKDCNPCNHLCFCESIICTGTMHMTQEKYNKWASIEAKQGARTKRESVSYGKILEPLLSYPRDISDNPFYTLFGYLSAKPKILKVKKLPSVNDIRMWIRQSGRTLAIPYLNTHILGVADGIIISQPLRK